MNANIHLDRGTRIRLAHEYIVADTAEQAENLHAQIRAGIIAPGFDQYGGATVTLASDGAAIKFVAFCAKRFSDNVFGFYIIDLATMQPVPYSPFCTGRGSISNAGFWIAWKDEDFWWGVIPGFTGYLDYGALIRQLTERVAALEARPLPIDDSARIAALEARIAALEARAPVPGPQGPQGVPGPQGPAGADGSGGALSTRYTQALERLCAWLGIA